MSRFVFLHASDLHLDSPFEDIGRVPSHLVPVLRDASLRAWEGLVDLAVERGAEFVLLAGDLYDGDERGVRAQAAFRRGLERLSERGIRVFLVHGNHDPLEGWSAIPEWPPGVTLFPAGRVTSAAVERDGRRLATVHGISYAERDCRENLALAFHRTTEPGLHIGLLHANVGGHAAHPLSAPCTLDDLRGAELDYWALGHVHERTYLSSGSRWIVYPGNLQSRRPAPVELGAKGAVVVEVENDRVEHVEFVALDQVRFVRMQVEVSPRLDGEALLDLLRRRGEQALEMNEARVLLLEASLLGGGSTLGLEAGSHSKRDLLERLRSASARSRPAAWWIDVGEVPDTAWVHRDAMRRRDDLAAALVRHCDAVAADPPLRQRFLEQCCEPLLRRWVAELEPQEQERVFRDAEALALDLLTQGGTS